MNTPFPGVSIPTELRHPIHPHTCTRIQHHKIIAIFVVSLYFLHCCFADNSSRTVLRLRHCSGVSGAEPLSLSLSSTRFTANAATHYKHSPHLFHPITPSPSPSFIFQTSRATPKFVSSETRVSTLANGVRVVSQDSNCPGATVGVYVNAGARVLYSSAPFAILRSFSAIDMLANIIFIVFVLYSIQSYLSSSTFSVCSVSRSTSFRCRVL